MYRNNWFTLKFKCVMLELLDCFYHINYKLISYKNIQDDQITVRDFETYDHFSYTNLSNHRKINMYIQCSDESCPENTKVFSKKK